MLSFQASRLIQDGDISDNCNQQYDNTIAFDGNQQHDKYKSNDRQSMNRLFEKTSRMIQSIMSMYDTTALLASEQKLSLSSAAVAASSSSASSSLSSSTSSASSSTSSLSSSSSITTRVRDDYNLRVDDLVAEGLDHHCDWNILPYILRSCREPLRSLLLHLPITISNNTSICTNPVTISTNSTASTNSTVSTVSTASIDEVIEGDIKLAIWYFRSAINPRRYIHLHHDMMILSCSSGGRHSHTHGDNHSGGAHGDDRGDAHGNSRGEDHADDHADDHGCIGPINNEDLHSYMNTTSTCDSTRDSIHEIVRNELIQKKRLSRLWSIICPHINAYCKEKLNQLSYRLR